MPAPSEEDLTGPDEAEAPVADSRPISILLVEDNRTNQELVKRLFKKKRYAMDVAENGIQAVEAFKNKTYTIIFMDCQMPEMDGFAATQAIRNHETENHLTRTPIIAMTANALTGDREKCLQYGMDDFLSKPIDPRTVFSMVSTWVNRQSDTASDDPVTP
jgi:CheY-like chemotaxis protein